MSDAVTTRGGEILLSATTTTQTQTQPSSSSSRRSENLLVFTATPEEERIAVEIVQ